MRSVFVLVFILVYSLDSFSQLFTFTFTGAGTCPTQGGSLSVQPAGLTVSSLTRMGTLTCSVTADGFNTAAFTNAVGMDTTQFIEFSITAASGIDVAATALNFSTSRTTKGPVNGLVAHDGGTGVFSTSNSFTINTTSAIVNWDFPDFTNVAGGRIKFRIYGWGANALTGTMRLDDLSFHGSVNSNTPIHVDHLNARIGIGTTAPTAQLHTTGTVRIEGLQRNDSLERFVVADTHGNLGYRGVPPSTTGWKLEGNMGLTSEQFLGSVDSTDIIFKRHNTRSGLISGSNASFGFNALSAPNSGAFNTAFGTAASKFTTGNSNTAVGFQSLFSNTTGNYNAAFGDGALVANVVGSLNVGIGAYSLNKLGSTGLTTGVSNHVALGANALWAFIGNARNAPNTAVGASAMAFTSTGDGNTAVGGASMYANTTGYDNTALGYWSLRFNTTGRENLAIGTTSLRQNTIGIQNVGIGREALRNDSSGNGNVGIGYQVGYSNFNGSKNVFIGYHAGYYETGSEKLYIANSATTIPLILGDFASGRVGIGTNKIADTAYKLFVETGIRTRKIKVDALTWADYVFDESYQLMPLPEVSKFITEYKHLPGVHSAADVAKTGVDLGDNQVILLQKIEELTLYIIELDKEVAALRKYLPNDFSTKSARQHKVMNK